MQTYVDRKKLAFSLSREQLDSLPLEQLQGVAQLVGTSGKCYSGKKDLIARIIVQQKGQKP